MDQSPAHQYGFSPSWLVSMPSRIYDEEEVTGLEKMGLRKARSWIGSVEKDRVYMEIFTGQSLESAGSRHDAQDLQKTRINADGKIGMEVSGKSMMDSSGLGAGRCRVGVEPGGVTNIAWKCRERASAMGRGN